jgi:undecaprenyl diphosphate synthase
MIPKHIAIILDGNGRWAKNKGFGSIEGHRKGAEVIEDITEYARDVGVSHITFYAFSTENWKRIPSWVSDYFKLLAFFLKSKKNKLIKENVKVTFIGHRSPLHPDIQKLMIDVEDATFNCTGIHVLMAINYGARDEIVRATRAITHKVQDGILAPSDITETLFNDHLYTKGAPAVDLLIRTSGEKRLSNFLLWQLAYSELVFMDVLWPDFTRSDFDHALTEFENRKRTFGC